MFDRFQPKTESEWIEQANRETRKFESILFPYTFRFEDLMLSATNTAESIGHRQTVEYELPISQELICPTISIMLAEPSLDTADIDMSRLGLEDVFSSLAQASRLFGGENKVSTIQSAALAYEHGDSTGIASFVEHFVKENKLGLTLYNSSVSNPNSPLSDKQVVDLTSLINEQTNKNDIRWLGIRGDVLGNEGATAVQELAASLSLLLAHWDQLTDQGVSVESLVMQTELALSLSGEFYLDVAKLKAARVLMRYILDAYGRADCNPYHIEIRAMSGTLNKSLYDPDANLMRNTVEALAATVGEADVVSLRCHDFRYNQPSEFGIRMAANIQHLLREEGRLHDVKNSVDGAYFFTKLIDDMVEQAWKLFLVIEKEGGYYRSGVINLAEQFHPNIEKREQELLQQKRTVVGVTRYANPLEKITNDHDLDNKSVPSYMKRWENVRRRIDKLPEEKEPLVAILGSRGTNNSMVSKKITFVTELLTTLGVSYSTAENSLAASLQKGQPAVIIFCGDDTWYESHLEEEANHAELALVPKIVVGTTPLLAELLQKRVIDAVIHAQADLLPLLNIISRVLP
ncbi:methylmalonyl-CoA mutase family protein [Tunicatimonas pelagia]|uniref:methylmalonyl-CoA mutase family protein n=1 Tax=Tunicatimonas pelagia TaxID=931531 RepID=UPI0026660561|nr:methylmalonyl-CoA mutase family protein [Tunicatimonas pelagia]WKN43351.1 methylmalonyl-CoA mutase family protein [Tunicatimonas pelagia]